MKNKAVIASGHVETSQAAAEIIAEGGNAYDACVAAGVAACIAEPMLCSLGGGGFLLARPQNGEAELLDFFVHSPKNKHPEPLDFFPIHGHFGEDVQEFHIGTAAMAVPGCVRGFEQISQRWGRLPFARLLEPGIRLARDGLLLSELQAYTLAILRPILEVDKSARRLFFSNAEPKQAGDRVNMPEFADFLHALGREGGDLFYKGQLAATVSGVCTDRGGHLSLADFAEYQPITRKPLRWRFANTEIISNPPPSTGGLLIACATRLLQQALQDHNSGFDLNYVQALAAIQKQVNTLRHDPEGLWQHCFRQPLALDQEPFSISRGTTQISIIDGQGNAASMTLSNGEGCGYIVPGTGVMMNNMLGEEDLNPGGFHHWQPDTRIASMMSPTIVCKPDQGKIALGSGGSNRIRSAILQVLAQHLLLGQALDASVQAPRLHLEGEKMNWEMPDFPSQATAWLESRYSQRVQWQARNIFFGGVHAVESYPDDQPPAGIGDPRRDGAWLTV